MNGASSTCNLFEIENKIRHAISESDVVDNKIKKALDTYDADKLALYGENLQFLSIQSVRISFFFRLRSRLRGWGCYFDPRNNTIPH